MKIISVGVLIVMLYAGPVIAEDMVIHCTNLSGEASPTGTFLMDCQAKVNSLNFAPGFTVQMNYADNASQKIAAIQDRAIQILVPLNVTVGTNDKKTVFGAPNN